MLPLWDPQHSQRDLKVRTGVTYEFITMRFGGMAARKRPMGRKAASAFRKSLKPPLPLKHVPSLYSESTLYVLAMMINYIIPVEMKKMSKSR